MYEEHNYEPDRRRSSPRNDRQDVWKDYSKPTRHDDDSIASRDLDRSRPFDDYRPRHDPYRDGSRSPRRDYRRRYNDRDREDYRSRSPPRKRDRSPYYGAPPSRTIIMEGLSANMTQEDVGLGHRFNVQILSELQRNFQLNTLEEVRLIKDKKTGLSRQFAFAQFASLEDSKDFLERNYPSICLYGPLGSESSGDHDGTNVRIAYSREKENREQPGRSEDDWKCDVCSLPNYSHRVVCFRCNAPRTRTTATGIMGVVSQTNMSSFSGFATTGDSDVSLDNVPSQYLLLRGLEPGVTEELLAKGVCKLYKATADNVEPTVNKKAKITSTSNDATIGARAGSLSRVLLVRDRKTNDSWRYGFAEFATVDDAQAAMAKFNAAEKFTISSKPVMVSYIHAGVFVPVLQTPSSDSEQYVFSPLTNPAVRLMYWDESAYVNELNTVKDDRSALTRAKESLENRLAAMAATAAAREGSSKDTDSKTKKRKSEKDAVNSSKKVVAPHLQFWSSRHAELHGLPAKSMDSDEPTPALQDDESNQPSQSYADMTRKCCLLCSRQFQTDAEVHKHVRVSQLHRDNMLNEDLRAKALIKLSKQKSKSAAASDGTEPDDSSLYRDRAKERRQAFNQPKQPGVQNSRSKSATNRLPKEDEETAPVASRGAALLGKMGWTSGQGLGADGTGRTEAIQTELYTQGVGIGAEGGKLGDAVAEAAKNTRGDYKDFVLKSREKAKERFEKMA